MEHHLIYRDSRIDFDEEFIDLKRMGFRPVGGISIAYHREHQCMYFSILMIKGR